MHAPTRAGGKVAKCAPLNAFGVTVQTAWLLLDQARIVQGEPVGDPAAFARRLDATLFKALG